MLKEKKKKKTSKHYFIDSQWFQNISQAGFFKAGGKEQPEQETTWI